MLLTMPRGCGGGQLTVCKSNCRNLATALEMYASDNDGYYPDRLEPALMQGNYLKSIPTCPAAGKATYSESYHTYKHRNHFRFSCSGNNHGKAYTGFNAASEDFPTYDAEQGLLDHP